MVVFINIQASQTMADSDWCSSSIMSITLLQMTVTSPNYRKRVF